MTGFSTSSFLAVSGLSLLAVVVLMLATAVLGRRAGRVSVVDTAWGLGFVVVALTAALAGQGSAARRFVLLAMVAAWGLRLA